MCIRDSSYIAGYVTDLVNDGDQAQPSVLQHILVSNAGDLAQPLVLLVSNAGALAQPYVTSYTTVSVVYQDNKA